VASVIIYVDGGMYSHVSIDTCEKQYNIRVAEIIRNGDLIVTPVVTDMHLARAYFNMLEENTLDTVCYQGRPTLTAFLAEYLTHGKRITLGCFREREDQEPEFAGMGWVSDAVKLGKHMRADTGMVFFRRQSRKTDNLMFGRMMLGMFFDTYKIDVIFGTTPEPNKLALRYAQRLGMDLSNPIPDLCSWHGELVPGVVSHISKAQWMERGR